MLFTQLATLLLAAGSAQALVRPVSASLLTPVSKPPGTKREVAEDKGPWKYHMVHVASGLCLAAGGDYDGAPLVLKNCDDLDAIVQLVFNVWAFPNTGWLCWDVPNGDGYNGATVQLWDCGTILYYKPNPNQEWSWTDVGNNNLTYVSWPLIAPEKCIEIKDGQAYEGAVVQLGDCEGSNPNQRFNYIRLK